MSFLVMHHQPLLRPKLCDRRRHAHEGRIVIAGKAGEDTQARAPCDEVADTPRVISGNPDAVAVMGHHPARRAHVGALTCDAHEQAGGDAVHQLTAGIDCVRDLADLLSGETRFSRAVAADTDVGIAAPDIDLLVGGHELSPPAKPGFHTNILKQLINLILACFAIFCGIQASLRPNRAQNEGRHAKEAIRRRHPFPASGRIF